MSLRARRRALVIAGGSVLAGVTLMAPACAATSGDSAAPAATSTAAGPSSPNGIRVQPGGAGHQISPRTTLRGARKATSTSTNWSGYAATGGNGSFTSVSSRWVEPTGTCRSGYQYSSFWVGLDGYTSTSVEQTGSEVDCTGRTPVYYSWYEMYPGNGVRIRNTVRPGDHFTGSVTFTRGSSFTLKLSDRTAGWSHTVTRTLSGATRSSAEVIAEAPCCTTSGGILPLADFGMVRFSGSTANGAPFRTFNPVGITMVSGNGVAEDTVSALSNGGNLTATWLSRGNGPRGGPRG